MSSLPNTTDHEIDSAWIDPAWIAFSRSENIRELIFDFHGFGQGLGFQPPESAEQVITDLMSVPLQSSFESLFDHRSPYQPGTQELISAFIVRGLDYRGIPATETQWALDYLSSRVRPDSPLHAYTLHHQCQRWVWEGQPATALKILDDFESAASAPKNEVLKLWQQALIDSVRGFALMELGNFRGATEFLQNSLKISQGLDFALQESVQFTLGSMFRESCQPQKAIELWYEPQRIQRMESASEWPRLVATHLNACRCAIDLKDASTALHALEKAEHYLPQIQDRYPRLVGYRHLRRGELCTLEEDYATGEAMLISAIEHFEISDPPCPEGWLEARLSLGQYALLQNNLPLAWAIVKKLVEEANEMGHIRLRSQALLMQTWFFVSESPPAEDSYQQTLDQVQMIHNPALLFHAFNNLLNYSVNHLGEQEAGKLREKMASLRSRLTETNYQQLIEKHLPNGLHETNPQ